MEQHADKTACVRACLLSVLCVLPPQLSGTSVDPPVYSDSVQLYMASFSLHNFVTGFVKGSCIHIRF